MGERRVGLLLDIHFPDERGARASYTRDGIISGIIFSLTLINSAILLLYYKSMTDTIYRMLNGVYGIRPAWDSAGASSQGQARCMPLR